MNARAIYSRVLMSRVKMARVLMAALCAASLASSAAEIETTSWGHFWFNPYMPTSIPSYETPGSDEFNPSNFTRRLILPNYYAWLDGYDNRAHAAIVSDPNPVPYAARRLAYFDSTNAVGSFLSRKDALRHGKLVPWWSPSSSVRWSTTRDLSSLPLEGNPYTDFTWTKYPLYVIYDGSDNPPYELHTRFCFNFDQLSPSSAFFPISAYSPYQAENDFQNMLRLYDFGKEPGYGEHPEIRNAFQCQYVSRSNWYYTKFDDVLATSFYTNLTEHITNTSHRLLWRTLGAANQALSLYDRSYHVPAPVAHVTQGVQGSAHARYTMKGELAVRFEFDYQSGWSSFEWDAASWESPSIETNYVTTTPIATPLSAPGACTVRIGDPITGTSFYVVPDDPGVTLFEELDSYYDVLATRVGSTQKQVVIETFDSGSNPHYISFRARLLDEPTFSESSHRVYFPSGMRSCTSADITARVDNSYQYSTVLNPYYSASQPVYPSGSLRNQATTMNWYLFASFCAVTNMDKSLHTGNLRDELSYFHIKSKDWGYDCKRYTQTGYYPMDYFDISYKSELGRLRDKCLSITGTAFQSDPKGYMDLTNAKIRNYVRDNPKYLTGQIEYHGVTTTNWLWYAGGHIRVAGTGETSINVGGARPIASMSIIPESTIQMPPPLAVDTYLGIVTEVDWDFYQMHRND